MQLADYMQQERRWAGAIEALREGTATACLSAAFLLTGGWVGALALGCPGAFAGC